MPQPTHDTGYKLLFSHARVVEDLLRGFVSEAWVEDLDFATLEKVSGSYITDDLREREDDLTRYRAVTPAAVVVQCARSTKVTESGALLPLVRPWLFQTRKEM